MLIRAFLEPATNKSCKRAVEKKNEKYDKLV